MDPQGTFAVLKTVFVSDYSRIHLLFKAWKAFSLLSRWPLFLLRLWNKSPTVHHHECIFFDFSESAALFWVAFSREKKVSFWLSFTFQISDAKSSWVAAHQKSITISSCLSAITSKASNRKISLEKIAQPFTPGKIGSLVIDSRLNWFWWCVRRLHVSQKKNKKLKFLWVDVNYDINKMNGR